jgi:hypothetical protein
VPNPDLARVEGGRKFLWDGRVYASRDEARAQAASYEADAFEVRLVEQDGQLFVYTRRPVKGAAEAAPG